MALPGCGTSGLSASKGHVLAWTFKTNRHGRVLLLPRTARHHFFLPAFATGVSCTFPLQHVTIPWRRRLYKTASCRNKRFHKRDAAVSASLRCALFVALLYADGGTFGAWAKHYYHGRFSMPSLPSNMPPSSTTHTPYFFSWPDRFLF